jgi:hypothetical protein
VVGHEVDDQPEAELGRAGAQGVEVVERAEERIDVDVVGDVVAGVVLGRRVERREPDRVDAEVGEGVQPRGDAGQVADAVAVRVGERARVHLVDDGRAPPLAAALGAGRRGRLDVGDGRGVGLGGGVERVARGLV